MPLLPLFLQPFQALHLPPPGSFIGQTVIITGANTGIGLETARHIVSLGAAKVILGVRALSKGSAAKSNIEGSTRRHGVIEVWEIDLEHFASVKVFAARAAKLCRVDVAIMNAGLASGLWNISDQGHERAIQVNVLSTGLLMLLLLPVLVRTRRKFSSSRPHLTVVGSDIHIDAGFEERKADNILEALNDKALWEKTNSANAAERYAVSKLLEHYVTYEVARLTPTIEGEPDVVVDIVTPGLCKSELMNREDGTPFILKALQYLTARTTVEGSKCVVDGASRGVEAHGQYLDTQKSAKFAIFQFQCLVQNSDCASHRVGKYVCSDEGLKLRDKFWKEVVEVLLPIAPEIERVLYGDL